MCDECKGKAVAAQVVDHIIPHRGDETLFWDERNWQSLAKNCHDAKTWREVHSPEARAVQRDAPKLINAPMRARLLGGKGGSES